MKTKLQVQIVWLLILCFCASSVKLLAQNTISGSFTSNGQSRSYSGAIPSNPNSNLRLVILFCGAYEFGFEMHNRGFDDHLANNTMVIYPEPYVTGTSFGNTAISNGADDFQMVEDLITHLMNTYSINSNDICIGGFSAGAFFSFALLCDFNTANSNRLYSFRAIASVSGAIDSAYLNYGNCPIAGAVPLIAFHGTVDNLANYNGGDLLYTGNISAHLDTALNYWSRTINSCIPNITHSPLPDLVAEQPFPSTVEFRDYGCSSAQRVHLYRVIDGRHYWPGGNASYDISSGRNLDINASQLIADFFNGTNNLSASESDIETPSISLYPNPLATTLNIESEIPVVQLSILNSSGEPILRQDSPPSIFNLEHIPKGLYLIQVQTRQGTEVHRIIKK